MRPRTARVAPIPRPSRGRRRAPHVNDGRPWEATMQLMARRRSTTGNHVAYATVFSKPPVAPIQHIHTAFGMQLLGLLCCHRPIRHGRGERRPWAYRGPIGHDGAAERRCPCPLLMRRRHWVKQCTLSAIPFSSGPMPPQRSATAASSPAARISCSHPCTVPQSQRAPNVLRGVSTRTERPWWLAPSDWNQTVPS